MTEPVFGILLAGGLARRMGGCDKGLKEIGGQTILARIIATIQPQCGGLILNANGDVSRLPAFGLPIVRDNIQDFAGPLAGILAGLDWIAAHHPQAGLALSVPADTPFLPNDLVARLLAARKEANADIALATSGGSQHPVVALWPVELRYDLRHALADEHIHKAGRFLERHKTAAADWPIVPHDPFFNVNEPEDIAAAGKILENARSGSG